VVKGFNNVSAYSMIHGASSVAELDTTICGDDEEALAAVRAFAEASGFRVGAGRQQAGGWHRSLDDRRPRRHARHARPA
jgi:predicted dinucleotide-binding enzyme